MTEAEIGRLVDLGILVPRDGPAPFLTIDLRKVRLAVACERAGLPMDAIAAAIRAGRLSFAFLEAAPYHRWAAPSPGPTGRSARTAGIPLDVLREALEAMGFAWTSPDEPIREDELEVVPLMGLAISSGILDKAWMARVGRAYAEGMRLAAKVENESYRARFEEPVLASGLGQRQAMERASELAAPFIPLVDRALMGIYRRQQELVWTEHQVENIEAALEEAGPWPGPSGCRRCASSTWPATPGSPRSAATRRPPSWPSPGPCWSSAPRGRGRHPGEMARRRRDAPLPRPGGAVGAAWHGRPGRGRPPPAHVGVAAGPVVVQGGDYFGRTVNLAARVAARAQAGRSWSPSRWPRPWPATASASPSWATSGSRASRPRSGSWRPGETPQPQTRLRWG